MSPQPHLNLHPSCPTSMKIKTLIHAHIARRICRLIQAMIKAKSSFIKLLRRKYNNKNKYNNIIHNNKNVFTSIRFHYNWSSSLVQPEPELEGYYYDSSWNSVIPTAYEEVNYEDDDVLDLPLPPWLEERLEEVDSNEIDRLAERFIEMCHEKFRLEKQESYRRYQEMLARSV
ncbi:hypothetical protein QJS10_CPA10g00097 [Acorus calamus]|uniref:Cotton fiber protein n=1 Tax=Acorus calamus TaxID=4465 RepID=A0AAV9E276_ACOCL|nr:hypothetical protein QJS10_CPA10g00097 [Acorus calamus]